MKRLFLNDYVQILPIFPKIPEIAGVRLIFDISIFILVTAVGLNIVMGIIVDSFSELRMERVGTS